MLSCIHGNVRRRCTQLVRGAEYALGLPFCSSKDFRAWAAKNHPPVELKRPTLGRKDNALGYTVENLAWIDKRDSARRIKLPPHLHRCGHCERTLPATHEHFGKGKGWRGLNSRCRDCRSVENRENYARRKLAAAVFQGGVSSRPSRDLPAQHAVAACK
jgi:hypothetical protein